MTLQDTFSLKINGKAQKVKMTMGLLHEVCSVIGHIELLAEAAYNPEIRRDLLITLLSARDEEGEIVKEINIKTLEASADETQKLLSWAAEHAADFLLKALQSSKEMLEARKALVTNLMPTSNGGEP